MAVSRPARINPVRWPSPSRNATPCERSRSFHVRPAKIKSNDVGRILIEGLPKVGLTEFLPVDGAFYLYADVSKFNSDSFEFAKAMLQQAHVAATPGVDFDPVEGKHFIRFSFAVSTAEVEEALRRITPWFAARTGK